MGKFKRHDKVRVSADGRTGKVLRVRSVGGGTEYLVSFGLYRWVWLGEGEIEKMLRAVK